MIDIQTALVFEISTARGVRPNLAGRAWVLPHEPTTPVPNESILELSGGARSRMIFSKNRNDIKIDARINDSFRRKLEEILDRGLPATLYSRMPGSSQLNAPLMDRINGDPDVGIYSGGGVGGGATGTRVFVLVPDDTYGGYAEEITLGSPIFIPRAYRYDAIASGPGDIVAKDYEAIFGSSFVSHRSWTNRIENSLLEDVTSGLPAGWTQSGLSTNFDVGECPWNPDLYAFLVHYSAAGYFQSPTFTVVAAEKLALSFYYETSADVGIDVVYDPAGSPTVVPIASSLHGSRWWTGSDTVPGGETTAAIRYKHDGGLCGGFSRICFPQAIRGQAHTPPIFVGNGSGLTGQIAGNGCQYPLLYAGRGIIEPSLIASGYCVPLWGAECVGPTMTIATFLNEDATSSFGVELSDYGGGRQLNLRVNNVVQDSDAMSHSAGNRYVWMLGWDASGVGLGQAFARLTNITNGNEYSVKYGSCLGAFTRLCIGHYRAPGGGVIDSQFDGMLNGVSVESINSASVAAYLRLLSNPGAREVWQKTAGRLFALAGAGGFSRDPYNPGWWYVTLSARELKRI